MPDELSGQAPSVGELHSSTSRGWLVDRLRAYWARDDSRRKDRTPPLGKAETITIGVILPAPEQTADGSVQGVERRLVYRIMRYWQKQCGSRQYPSLSDIDPEAIADMWPSCFVLEMNNSTEAPYFHYLGKSLAKYSGVFLGGEKDWSLTLLDKATERLRDAVDHRQPVMLEDEIVRYDGTRLLFRSILMPLSDDGENINYLLGAANGKILSADSAA